MKEAIVKRLVLERDNHCCRSCGAKENLEAHHIISKEEQALMGIDRELSKFLDQPDYRITLCIDCHTTTYFRSAIKHLYSTEEQNELKDIDKRTRELSERRKELRKSYSNQWDMKLYQSKKQQLDESLRKLQKRKIEIVEEGKSRAFTLRQQVIKLCEEHLLNVVSKENKQNEI